jgi:predicted PurR-regulated permease PerM
MFRKIEISHRTIVFTVLFLIFLWFLYFIKDIIFALFVSLFLMAILDPIVERLIRWKIPRTLAVFFIYLILIGLLAGVVLGIVPPLVDQTTNFINNFPNLLKYPFVSNFINEQTINNLVNQFSSIPGQVFKVGVSIFSNVVGVISVMIFTFYMLLYRGKFGDQVGFTFGVHGKDKFGRVMNSIEKSLGNWARGQLILMGVLGTLVYLGLVVLRIPYALPLAILTGLLEIVPTIGIVVAAIPIVIIGLSISPMMGLATAALVFLVHLAESYVLAPKVIEKSAGVNPIVTLASLAIGYRLMGVVGAFISVPVVLLIQIVVKEYLRNKE